MSELKKSSDMPEPQVMNYWQYYKVNPVFRKDLETVLGEIAYVDAKKIFDILDENNDDLSSARLNYMIRQIGNLPYKYVNKLMAAINDQKGFGAYFTVYEKDPSETNTVVAGKK